MAQLLIQKLHKSVTSPPQSLAYTSEPGGDMHVDVRFGYWLKRRRKALDVTQEELARRVGYSVSAIRKVEADKLRPSKRVAEQLAEALKIPPEERPAFMHFARDDLAVDELELPIRSVPAPQPALRRRPPNSPSPLTSF